MQKKNIWKNHRNGRNYLDSVEYIAWKETVILEQNLRKYQHLRAKKKKTMHRKTLRINRKKKKSGQTFKKHIPHV